MGNNPYLLDSRIVEKKFGKTQESNGYVPKFFTDPLKKRAYQLYVEMTKNMLEPEQVESGTN